MRPARLAVVAALLVLAPPPLSGAGASEACTVSGTAGNDVLEGTPGPDVICGLDGADTLIGGDGDDVLIGGPGDDLLRPGPGDDVVQGGAGTDTVSYAAADAGVVVDLWNGTAAGEGADALSSVEDVTGSRFADALRGDGRANRIQGKGGADTLSGYGAADRLEGGPGGDTLYGGAGKDHLVGGLGSDACTSGDTRASCEASTFGEDWLPVVNLYRGMSGLSPVTEDLGFSAADRLHARYVVKNDEITHVEEPGNPFFTQPGAEAGLNSLVFGHSRRDLPDRAAVDGWMTGPFHALPILAPGLVTVGYGLYREADGGLQYAGALDVIRGLGPPPPSVTYPIPWPGDGSTVPLTSYTGGETPDPLASCPGFSPPTGLPVTVQYEDLPVVEAHSFRTGGSSLTHCVFVDGVRLAVVLIPKAPLKSGKSYTASVTVDGDKTTWTFSVS